MADPSAIFIGGTHIKALANRKKYQKEQAAKAAKVYVSYKDIKKVIVDLEKIYGAVTLEEAEKNLQAFAQAWRSIPPA